MTHWAVGDIQGCRVELDRLLDKVAFGATDQLWLVGDLVNRGPDSLGVLRLLRKLGPQVRSVLGNHDLHLLAIYFGGHSPNRGDTFGDVLAARDVDTLAHWLLAMPLLIADTRLEVVMTHAGVPHIWSLQEAQCYAAEVEAVLRGSGAVRFFEQLYGNEPDRWRPALQGMDRLRLITNYFTRMRLLDQRGRLEFKHKGDPDDAPSGFAPWFEWCAPQAQRLIFGHWAALTAGTGRDDIVALDTGCVWGRKLTAMNLETGALVTVRATDGAAG